VCSMTYGQVYRTEMTGETIHTILEDVADNIFNADPYYQQGGDMVRIGGMAFACDVSKPIGQRITNMVHLKSGETIDPTRTYMVGGWGSVNEGTEGPMIWDVIESHLKKIGTVKLEPNTSVTVTGL
ncbi:MAG: 5'-nucleotidase C-terminal domain-containing protein, partial [Rhodobacteraceae bacterium]|nr:5'-nucleotidase C-terminal domain-containing protein [Paracoccaceae bacterium]